MKRRNSVAFVNALLLLFFPPPPPFLPQRVFSLPKQKISLSPPFLLFKAWQPKSGSFEKWGKQFSTTVRKGKEQREADKETHLCFSQGPNAGNTKKHFSVFISGPIRPCTRALLSLFLPLFERQLLLFLTTDIWFLVFFGH